MKKIIIKINDIKLEAELTNSETAEEIYNALPITAKISTWGDEIYFEIPVHVELDQTAKEVVDKGDLGFWPQGDCFCIFYGPTPASKGNEIRPASKVNIFGKVTSDTEILKTIKDNPEITIEKA
ncbi:MAG: cyclophilin-like fold protein [Candidatus Woesearchaeota archaeon]|jgi:hypothetical protein|nr:cyclophilin-like fold protein [Candidatus Woesearchaeota archaeon]